MNTMKKSNEKEAPKSLNVHKEKENNGMSSKNIIQFHIFIHLF